MQLIKKNTREDKLILRALAHTTQIEKKVCMSIGNKLNKLSEATAEQYKTENKLYDLEIPMHEITEQLNTNYMSIKNACLKLTSRKIFLKTEEKVKSGKIEIFDSYFVIFPSARISDNNFKISINPAVLPLFNRALKIYRHYNIIEAKFLTHKHSIEMYKFLKDKVNQGIYEFTISVEKLRYELGLEGKYKAYKNFKMRVLDPVNSDMLNSAIQFDYIEIKPSRSVTDLRISIKEDKESKAVCYLKEALRQYPNQHTTTMFHADFTKFLEEYYCFSKLSKTIDNVKLNTELDILKTKKSITDYNHGMQSSFIEWLCPELLPA